MKELTVVKKNESVYHFSNGDVIDLNNLDYNNFNTNYLFKILEIIEIYNK